MAIAVTEINQYNSTEGFGTGGYTTPSFTPGNNCLLCVAVMGVNNADTSVASNLTISGGGLTWSRSVIAESLTAGNEFCAWYTAPVVTGASMTITVDSGGDSIYQYFVHVHSTTGHNTSSPVGATGTYSNAAGGSPVSYNLGSAPSASSYKFAAGITDGGGNIVTGTGWTEGFLSAGASPIKTGTEYITGTTSQAILWNTLSQGGTDGAASAAMEIKEAGAGGGALTLDAAGGTYSVTGTAASLERGREVAANAGTYAVSGTAASLERGYETAANAGSYTVSGTAATFPRTYLVPANGGSYSVSGTAASLERGYELPAQAGSYAVNGTDAALEHGYELAAGAASYTVSGTDATLTVTSEGAFSLTAEAGSYVVAGADVAFQLDRLIAASAGSYSVSGSDASIERGRPLAAESGSYSVSGADVSFMRDYVLQAADGSYVVVGSVANLLYSAEPQPEEPDQGAGGRITGGTFSRKKWRELREAQQQAERAAAETRSRPKREALQKAAAAAESVIEADIADEAEIAKMARVVEAAASATRVKTAILEARKAVEIAEDIIGLDDEDDAILMMVLNER